MSSSNDHHQLSNSDTGGGADQWPGASQRTAQTTGRPDTETEMEVRVKSHIIILSPGWGSMLPILRQEAAGLAAGGVKPDQHTVVKINYLIQFPPLWYLMRINEANKISDICNISIRFPISDKTMIFAGFYGCNISCLLFIFYNRWGEKN